MSLLGGTQKPRLPGKNKSDAHKKKDIKLLALDVDDNPHKPVEYAITRLPSLFLIQSGQITDRWPNNAKSDEFSTFIEKYLETEN